MADPTAMFDYLTPTQAGTRGIPIFADNPSGGEYSADQQYLQGNIVRYGGSTWSARVPTKGNTPPTLPTLQSAFWTLFTPGIDADPAAIATVSNNLPAINEANENIDAIKAAPAAAGSAAGSAATAATSAGQAMGFRNAAEGFSTAAAGSAAQAVSSQNIAAGYASDMSTRSDTVPIYATVLGMSALSLPAGLNSFETRGYAQPGDFGGWTAVEIPIISADKPWNVVTNNGTRRWELRADEVWLEMFGGKADATGSGATLAGTDNIPAINAALAYNRANVGGVYGSVGTIRAGFGKYAFFSAIKVKVGGRLASAGAEGAGNQALPSQFLFPPNCDGIVTNSYNTVDQQTGLTAGTDASGFVIERIQLIGGGGTDRDKHGIRMRCRTICRGLRISGFAGNGYDIRSGSGGDGNINNWEIWGGRVTGCLNGIYTSGGDANAGNAYHVDCSSNLSHAILDNSFLGNSYYGCHANGNGVLGQCSHGGNRYRAVPYYVHNSTTDNYADPGRLGRIEPGTDATAWELVSAGTPSSGYPTWVSGGEYYVGGQFSSIRPTSASAFFGGYTEGGWPASYIASPGAAIGGNHSAGFHARSTGAILRNGNLYNLASLTSSGITSTGSASEVELATLVNAAPSSGRNTYLSIYSGYLTDGITKRGAARITGRSRGATQGTELHLSTWDGTNNVWRQSLTVEGVASTINPGEDNVWSLGTAALRFKQLFAGTGTINTSDERTKQQIEAIPDEWLDAWAEVEWCRFKFNDAVAEKGEDGARWHFGLIAQRVADVFVKHGIDPYSAGLVCYDEWGEEREEIIETVTIPAVTEPTFRSVPILDDQGQETGEFTQEPGEDRMIEEERTEEIHTGEFRVIRDAGNLYGIRYEEAFAIEAAYQRRCIEQIKAQLQTRAN